MRPTNLISKLLITVFFFGCNKPEKKTDFKQALQGDWITPRTPKTGSKSVPVFSFRGCQHRFSHSSLKPYSLSFDTLSINTYGDNSHYTFKILRADQDSLFLQVLPSKSGKRFTFFEAYDELDTFKLVKVKPKHKAKIRRIGFYSTACFGECPSMHFELDSIGNMLFWGKEFTNREGLFSGKITDSALVQIKRSIHNVPLDSQCQSHIAWATDCPTYGLKLITKSEEYEIEFHCNEYMHPEIHFLMEDLLELYRSADLKIDSTIDDKRKLLDFSYFQDLLPPPLDLK